MTCSFCAFYKKVDAADRVVVINGHSACMRHAEMLYEDGDWLIALSQVQP